MNWLWALLTIGGAALSLWARAELPFGTIDFPVPPKTLTNRGPYRHLRHPMYLGTVAMVAGLGGLGGGFWNALALFTITELVTREWAWREDGGGR